MTAAWATWTASLPFDSSRSERTAITSLYSIRPAPSVQLRGALLLERFELRLDALQLDPGAVPQVLVVGAGLRGLHLHPALRVLDRPPQGLPLRRELLELESGPVVP